MHWLEVNEISNLIRWIEGSPFKFVFISTCHSGLTGERFTSAGVPHVVCCQQQSELRMLQPWPLHGSLAKTHFCFLPRILRHVLETSRVEWGILQNHEKSTAVMQNPIFVSRREYLDMYLRPVELNGEYCTKTMKRVRQSCKIPFLFPAKNTSTCT